MKKNLILLAAVGLAAFTLAACSSSSNSGSSAESKTEAASKAEQAKDSEANSKEGDTEITVEKGKLIMATNAEFPPYEFHENDKIVGIDAEIAEEIAKKLGLELEIEDVAFSAIIPEITSGKADVGIAGMSVTEDRKKSVDFSQTYADTVQVVIVKKDSEIKTPEELEKKTLGVQE